MPIAVHQTRPATPSTASWVRAPLGPAVEICRITSAPPLELRPSGAWGGWCSTDLTETPDRRVSVSNQVVLLYPDDLVRMYLHETAHRLLLDVDKVNSRHCPIFFAFQMLLFLRLASSSGVVSRPGGWTNAVHFYDLQDPPECLSDQPRAEWLPRCLSWAMSHAAELAATELTAEACATELVSRFGQWVTTLEKEPALKAAAEAQAQGIQEATSRDVDGLRSLSRVYRFSALVGWGLFLMSFIVLIFVTFR